MITAATRQELTELRDRLNRQALEIGLVLEMLGPTVAELPAPRVIKVRTVKQLRPRGQKKPRSRPRPGAS